VKQNCSNQVCNHINERLINQPRQRRISKVTIFSLFLMLVVVPYTVFAECKIIDTPEKYEVVCSGPDSMPLASDSKKIARKLKTAGTSKKVNFEDRKKTMQTVAMNDEESQFMLARNRQDGYGGKAKPGEHTGKK